MKPKKKKNRQPKYRTCKKCTLYKCPYYMYDDLEEKGICWNDNE